MFSDNRMVKRRPSRASKRNKTRKTRRRIRRQRGGNAPLVGLLDNADGVPILKQQNIEFHVKFEPASVKSASEFGNTLTIEQSQPEPHVYWAAPTAGAMYTFVCWDPDSPAKSWLHWLVMNCKGDKPSTGDTVVDWSPPAPPRGSGLHRYIFALFMQAGPVIPPTNMKSNGGFHMANFATQHQLTPLVYKGIRVNA
jgi:phosphatidylethanolamine-binding protein